jgi:hypothetical protein
MSGVSETAPTLRRPIFERALAILFIVIAYFTLGEAVL